MIAIADCRLQIDGVLIADWDCGLGLLIVIFERSSRRAIRNSTIGKPNQESAIEINNR